MIAVAEALRITGIVALAASMPIGTWLFVRNYDGREDWQIREDDPE